MPGVAFVFSLRICNYFPYCPKSLGGLPVRGGLLNDFRGLNGPARLNSQCALVRRDSSHFCSIRANPTFLSYTLHVSSSQTSPNPPVIILGDPFNAAS